MAAQREQPRRILVVDDSDAARILARIVLRASEHEVVEATGGEEALRLCALERFDLIITDQRMPHGDGFWLAHSVRASGGPNTSTPIALMTSEVEPEVWSHARDAGIARVLLKPFDPADLTAMVNELCAEPEPGALGGLASRITVNGRGLLETLPYPAIVMDEDRRVILANRAFYSSTCTGICEWHAECAVAVHADGAVPPECPFDRAVETGAPAMAEVREPDLGLLCVSVYPLTITDDQGRRLYLHVSPLEPESKPAA